MHILGWHLSSIGCDLFVLQTVDSLLLWGPPALSQTPAWQTHLFLSFWGAPTPYASAWSRRTCVFTCAKAPRTPHTPRHKQYACVRALPHACPFPPAPMSITNTVFAWREQQPRLSRRRLLPPARFLHGSSSSSVFRSGGFCSPPRPPATTASTAFSCRHPLQRARAPRRAQRFSKINVRPRTFLAAPLGHRLSTAMQDAGCTPLLCLLDPPQALAHIPSPGSCAQSVPWLQRSAPTASICHAGMPPSGFAAFESM